MIDLMPQLAYLTAAVFLQKWCPGYKTKTPFLYYMGRLLVGFFLDVGGQEAYKLAVAVHGYASLFDKAHSGVVIVGISLPAGHQGSVSVWTVGVAGLDEVAPVVAHLAG